MRIMQAVADAAMRPPSTPTRAPVTTATTGAPEDEQLLKSLFDYFLDHRRTHSAALVPLLQKAYAAATRNLAHQHLPTDALVAQLHMRFPKTYVSCFLLAHKHPSAQYKYTPECTVLICIFIVAVNGWEGSRILCSPFCRARPVQVRVRVRVQVLAQMQALVC